MTLIKVSGLKEPDDARRAAELGADIVACVFWAPSPRYVSAPQAWAIRSALPPHVRFGGIFLDTPSPIVQHLASQLRLDMIQLFGHEPRDAVEAVGPRAYKAVTVLDRDQVQSAVRQYASRRGRNADVPALLLHLGGEIQVDWTSAVEPASRGPLLLASDGLDADNAVLAVSMVKPWGIDVWETIEREPGRLDASKLERLVSAVRVADEKLTEGK